MLRLTRHVIILAVLCFSLQQTKADDLKNYLVKSRHFVERRVYTSRAGIDETNYVYAACYFSAGETDSKCEVGRLSNNQNPDKYCNVTLKIENDHPEIVDVVVTPLNEKKVLLVWADNKKTQTLVKHTIVNFDNCHATQFKITTDNVQYKIPTLVHNKHYDLWINDSKSCGDKFCKFTFDYEGTKIAGPTPLSISAQDETYIDLYPAPDALILTKYGPDKKQVTSLIKSDDGKVLKDFSDVSDSAPAYSTNYGVIRMCLSTKTVVSCEQFDQSGKSIAEHKIDIGYSVVDLEVHNLPNGGYVLMTNGCTNPEHGAFCHRNEDHYNLTKVNADGTKAGGLKIHGLMCLGAHDQLDSKFFENEAKEVCLSQACFEFQKSGSDLSLVSKCFADNEFIN